MSMKNVPKKYHADIRIAYSKDVTQMKMLMVFCIGVALIGGIMIGAVVQQMIFGALAVEFAEGLEGTNIEVNVDINETMIVEGTREALLFIFNETEAHNSNNASGVKK